MPTLYWFHGRIVDLRRFSNVHQLYGRRPLGPSDRYEIWIKDSDGDERKFTVNTRTMPARRGHEVSLIITPNKARRVVGLGNWSTVDAVNYVRVDPPALLHVADVAVVLAILVSMTVTLGGAGAALSVPVAFAYMAFAAIGRCLARRRLARNVDRAIDFEARRTSKHARSLR